MRLPHRPSDQPTRCRHTADLYRGWLIQAQPLFSLRNPWFTTSVIVTAAIALIAGGFGFIWLPMMERNTSFPDVWIAIWSAAGLTQSGAAPGVIVQPSAPWPQIRPVPEIVESGAPMRGIAPCGACHGPKAHKLGTPWLEGEPVAYLRAQLAGLQRRHAHNDINQIMRNVARQMTPVEIDATAQFCGVSP